LDGDAVLIDQERVLIGSVDGAAVLHHPQTARGNLAVHPMIEQDDTIRNVFLQALPGELAIASLSRFTSDPSTELAMVLLATQGRAFIMALRMCLPDSFIR